MGRLQRHVQDYVRICLPAPFWITPPFCITSPFCIASPFCITPPFSIISPYGIVLSVGQANYKIAILCLPPKLSTSLNRTPRRKPRPCHSCWRSWDKMRRLSAWIYSPTRNLEVTGSSLTRRLGPNSKIYWKNKILLIAW